MINIELNSNWFNIQSKLSPDITFIIYKGKSYTYREVESLVAIAAGNLLFKGIKENEYVFLVVKNNFEFVISLLALWQIKATPVIVNPNSKPEELKERANLFGKYKIVDDADLYKKNIENDLPNSNYSDTAIIIFTSGSTGIPKAVELTFENLYYSAMNADSILKQTYNDKWLASLPFHHIGGFSIIARTLLSACSIIIPDEFDTKNFIENIKHKPAFFSVVPTMLMRIIEAKINCYPELKCVLLGGAKCNSVLICKALKKDYPILKVYGATETSSFVAVNDLRDPNSNFESAGKAIGDNIIEIDKSENDSPGEVIVKGKSVAKQYLNNDPKFKDRLTDGIFRTGDIGYYDEKSNLHIHSRKDNMIISGGINVYPGEIEKKLLKIDHIKEAVVFSTISREWGDQINAAVVVKNAISEKEIKLILKEKIADYKIPKVIHVVSEIPKTELGKVDKNKLRALIKKDENLNSHK